MRLVQWLGFVDECFVGLKRVAWYQSCWINFVVSSLCCCGFPEKKIITVMNRMSELVNYHYDTMVDLVHRAI